MKRKDTTFSPLFCFFPTLPAQTLPPACCQTVLQFQFLLSPSARFSAPLPTPDHSLFLFAFSLWMTVAGDNVCGEMSGDE